MSTPPKVLVFTRTLLPRSETFIHDHVTSLRRYKPTLVGLSGAPNSMPLDGIDARTLDAGGTRRQRIAFAFSPFRNALDRMIETLRPDLIHVHFVTYALYILPVARRHRVPLVVTAHGSDVSIDPAQLSPIERALVTLRTRGLARRVDRLLCVSELIRGFAIERGFPPDRTTVHHLGISIDRFTQRESLPVPGRILFVGRLVEKKNLADLIRAVAVVRAGGATADLHIVGDGPERAELEALSAELGVDAVFLGAQPRERVEAELSAAWMFAMPSRRSANGDSEGLPIVFLEAEASGVPVVAFDNGAAREAVDDGRTGLLAADGDVADLAVNIARLLGDTGLRERLSDEARRWVADNFDLHDQTADLEAIYDRVVEEYAVGTPRAYRAGRGSGLSTPSVLSD